MMTVIAWRELELWAELPHGRLHYRLRRHGERGRGDVGHQVDDVAGVQEAVQDVGQVIVARQGRRSSGKL